MLKKISVVLLSALVLVYCWGVTASPVFAKYSSEYEVYQKSNSSNATITTVSKREYAKLLYKYGESCVVEKDDFSVDNLFKDFNAKLVWIEKTSYGTSYYAYSPKIKYSKLMFNKKVNLQVFIGEQIKLGTPIIYGSY